MQFTEKSRSVQVWFIKVLIRNKYFHNKLLNALCAVEIIFYLFFLFDLLSESNLGAYFNNSTTLTAQNMKFSSKDFWSKCDQIRSFLRIWSHLLQKSLMENFIFYAVSLKSVIFPNFLGNNKIINSIC